jgi:hypothetical protein
MEKGRQYFEGRHNPHQVGKRDAKPPNERPLSGEHENLQGKEMNEARKQFEAILMTKGKRAPGWDGEKYDNTNIQTYWRWFLLGWTMKDGK